MHRRTTVIPSVICAIASALVPGLGQALQRRFAAALGFFSVSAIGAGLLAWSATRDRLDLVTWTLDPEVLRRLFWAGLLWAVVCAVAAADAAIAAWPRPTRAVQQVAGTVVFVALVLVATVPGTAGAWAAWRQESLLTTVFDDGGTATGALVARPTGDNLSVAGANRWNIALLGGDAAPGRPGLRTDAMIVVSIDPATGDVAMISVPRNMERLPMPAGPLRDEFPKGFDDLANALYPYVENHPDVAPSGPDPAAQAVKGALAELLGIPIQHYVLVDMAGFVDIIDALGGVTVTIPTKLPSPGNPPGAKHPVPKFLGPGVMDLDGTLALAYARSRTGDSDYQRMQRQRCLLAAAASSLSPTDLVRRYNALANAVEDNVRSDLPSSRLGELARLFADVDVANARTLSLTPPLVTPAKPDKALVRQLVHDLFVPPAADAGAAPSTDAAPAASTTSPGAAPSSAADQGPTTTAAVQTVGATC